MLAFEGQTRFEPPQAVSAVDVRGHRIECLYQLRRADEVLRACKVTLRPLVETGGSDPDAARRVSATLRDRLNELEILCMRPLLFHGEATFFVVHRLKEKLFQLCKLLGADEPAALSYWQRDVAGEFQPALSTIFREVDRLMREI